MKHLVPIRFYVASIAACLVGGAPVVGQGTIVLRSAARIADGRDVTVSDVAVLSGPDAAPLAAVVVIPAAERSGRAAGDRTVDADRVRRAIDAWAGPRGVNWGRLTLSGAACDILPASSGPPPAPPPAAPVEPPPGPTVRTVVEARLRQLLAVEATDLRLNFDENDREIFALSTAGRTVDVRPAGSSERMPLAIAVYDTATGRLLQARTVRVGVEVRREVGVARTVRQRGEILGESDVSPEERWISPADTTPPIDRVIGAAARGRLTPGQMIRASDIEPPIIIRKGELVSVHSVNGLVIVRLTARALGPARDGEVVRLQSMTDEKRTFYARMDGRGRATAVVHDIPEETRR